MRRITWEEISELCRKLAQDLQQCPTAFHAIFAVPRGGLPIGVHLSHLTGIPMDLGGVIDDSLQYVIVDDINDTGRTMTQYVNKENCVTVALFERVDSSVAADYVGEYVNHNDWLVMPWEVMDNAFEDMLDYAESRRQNE